MSNEIFEIEIGLYRRRGSWDDVVQNWRTMVEAPFQVYVIKQSKLNTYGEDDTNRNWIMYDQRRGRS